MATLMFIPSWENTELQYLRMIFFYSEVNPISIITNGNTIFFKGNN